MKTTDANTTRCFIHNICTAVPDAALDAEGSARLLRHGCVNPRTAKLLQRVARLTGIERRHLAALKHSNEDPAADAMYKPATVQPHGPGMSARTRVFDIESGPLVAAALRDFSRDELRTICTLVTVSCTHASSPGLERPIFANTPIPPTVDRWNLGFMGCSAGLAGVRLVQQASKGQEALVLACELSSLHFQYTEELDQMTANVLFADGAAGVLLSPRPSALEVVACRSVVTPEHAEQMIWHAGDHGLQLRLSQDLPETLAKHLPQAVESFLCDHGLQTSDIEHWLVHPGGPQILDVVQTCLGLTRESLDSSWSIFREYGNMSSPTIFFIIKRHFEKPRSGYGLALAFGPGLTIEMVLLRSR